MERLILRSFLSPGDVVMLTAAVRDLHAAHPGQFQTDIRTSADALWENNPYLTKLREGDAGVESIDMHYPLVHQSNQRPYHFIHGYAQYLEQRLGVRIPLTKFQGDIHLTAEEKNAPAPGVEQGVPERFWIVISGGKNDFTAKWWNPESYQKVVDHFRGKIQFVQCGEAGHWHPPLEGVVNLVGKTSLRELVRLMYHAEGVLCPVTLAMHLAAAVEAKPGQPQHRACVVVAGGREPAHWEAYPLHQYISTNGMLDCCEQGGCWKSRCQLIGDGDRKDRHDVCTRPVQIRDDLRIPECLEMITPEDVIRRIELYYQSGWYSQRNENLKIAPDEQRTDPVPSQRQITRPAPDPEPSVLVTFQQNGDDLEDKTILFRHLTHYYPQWKIKAAVAEQHIASLKQHCPQIAFFSEENINRGQYNRVLDLRWDERAIPHPHFPSRRATQCLLEELKLTPIRSLFLTEGKNGQPRNTKTEESMATANTAAVTEILQTKTPVLIKFSHGLGDAVQFGIVLKHLRQYRPEWEVDVRALRGKHSALHGLCRQVFHDQEPQPDETAYDRCFDIKWQEQNRPYDNLPSTKVARCLIEEFGIDPDPGLFTYQINVENEAYRRTAEYLQSICPNREPVEGRYPVLLLHYEGNTSQKKKNLSHETAEGICQAAIGAGLVPVILDWDGRSPLPDQKQIFCPPTGPGDLWGGFGSGDTEILAALIEQSALLIGVDSGPLHVAGATTTPTLGVWTDHFPPQYFDLADNVTHFVPTNWRKLGFGNTPSASGYFLEQYRYQVYENLMGDLMSEVASQDSAQAESSLMRSGEFWIRRDNVEQDMVIVRDQFPGGCLLHAVTGQ